MEEQEKIKQTNKLNTKPGKSKASNKKFTGTELKKPDNSSENNLISTQKPKKRKKKPTNKKSFDGQKIDQSMENNTVNEKLNDLSASPIVIQEVSTKIEKITIIETIVDTKIDLVMDETKSREEIKAEREAKKLAKQINKNKGKSDKTEPAKLVSILDEKNQEKIVQTEKPEKVSISKDSSREQILAEREAKKLAKQAAKSKSNKVEDKPIHVNEQIKTPVLAPKKDDVPNIPKQNSDTDLAAKLEHLHINDEVASKAKTTTKAERRAIQEAQRAAKAKLLENKEVGQSKISKKSTEIKPSTKENQNQLEKNISDKPLIINKKSLKPVQHRVKLFSHLYIDKQAPETLLNDPNIHPAIIRLGVQYSKKNVVGSNARCIALLNAMKLLIHDYVTPQKKVFSRGLETMINSSVEFLLQCRPMSVSMTNALKFIKWQITQLPAEKSDNELKNILTNSIETYIHDQIEKAAQAISTSVQQKISNGDVILTFGCSSLIKHILEEAHRRKVDFRVVIVDARPLHEGQEMLRRLVEQGINCTCVLINAAGFIMPEVTKVLLGAHALLANGYVMSRAGTAQIALVAKSYNVPVLVCCETHKFSERVQTDAFVYNEIGDPDDLVFGDDNSDNSFLNNWSSISQLTPLHLYYDITPPELVTAVVTELAILPCTSVPVILRIKPSEIGY